MEYLLYSEDEILERVDEYTLYCFYLGYQPSIGKTYHSPVRRVIGLPDDDSPSFGIYEATSRTILSHEFVWRDNANKQVGNIFKLVQLLFRYETRRQAMLKVMSDFGVGGSNSDPKPTIEKVYQEPIDITVNHRNFNQYDYWYWNQFNVDRNTLDRFNVKPISCYWLTASQTVPKFPKGKGYDYQIWDKHQLYFPEQERHRKFRNNLTEACVFGFLQLRYTSPLLVITKAMKDVMTLSSFGYEAIAPRGENIMLPKEAIAYMKRKYRRIIILFDNDGKHKGNEYEFEKVFVPQIIETDKDPSDFTKNHGTQEAASMLRQIIKP